MKYHGDRCDQQRCIEGGWQKSVSFGTEVGLSIMTRQLSDMRFLRGRKRSDPEFLADSAEQIAESIDRTGLRDKIAQAFTAAITKVRERQDKSCEPD
jgi:hypothetical protein